MARNPYDNGRRGFGSRPRELQPSTFPGEYGGDLDEGRFQTRPLGAHRDPAFGAHRDAGFEPAHERSQQRMRNRGPRNWQRSDDRIQDDVCTRLSALDDVDVSEVSVSVHEGRVTLSGTVEDRWEKYRVEDVADDCAGVRDIDNQIRIARGRGRESRGGGFWAELFGFESGSKARDVMTRNVLVVSPQDTVQRAAQIMKDADIGSVPVCDGQRLKGMITDRDIAVRVAASSLPAGETQVSQAMTSEVFWCYEEDDIADVLDKMGDRQVRRIPVVDRDHRLAGIVSLGDLAVQRTGGQVDTALEQISEPSKPH